jgi:hypothetical protein
MGGSNGQQMPQGMNAIGEQQYAAGTVPKAIQATPEESAMFKQQQQYQNQQQLNDLLSSAGKTTQTTASPYDRAAKSQSDSASAWTAMQRSSGDGTGSLGFSPMGGYSIPPSGAEKVAQGWEDAAKTILTPTMAIIGKLANKTG